MAANGSIPSSGQRMLAAWSFATTALRWVGGAILVGIFLAMLGPFGSYLNGGPVRLIFYWVGTVLLGLALYGAAFKIVSRWVAPGTLYWWSGLVVATLLASVPHMFTARAAAFWLWPTLANLDLSAVLWYKQTVAVGLVAMLGAAFVISQSAKRQIGRAHV